jgi:PPOX class F420-dependent enzyme/OxyR family protein
VLRGAGVALTTRSHEPSGRHRQIGEASHSRVHRRRLAYLRGQRLERLATANTSGLPHVVPTSFSVDAAEGVIEIGGHDAGGRRRYRANIEANPQAAFVVDDLASVNPWRARGIEVIGPAEVKPSGGECVPPLFPGPRAANSAPTRSAIEKPSVQAAGLTVLRFRVVTLAATA